MNILLTGGAGYIGSHIAVSLSLAGYNPIILDSFVTSDEAIVDNIIFVAGRSIPSIKCDVRDVGAVLSCLINYEISAVIHLAGFKSVSESYQCPEIYYSNNLGGIFSLIEAMNLAGIKKLLFSSSASIYGEPLTLPIDENHPPKPLSPYAKTKYFAEQFLHDLVDADPSWSIVCLRYFNPVGSHESGLLGENLNTQLGNLMPALVNVALEKTPFLNIYGGNFSTPDGTAIRDFIHVVDLAEAHLSALSSTFDRKGWDVFNVGVGKGFSVLEMINMFELQSSKKIPVNMCAQRPGEIAVCYSSPKKINQQLGWVAKRTLDQMCFSAWFAAKKIN